MEQLEIRQLLQAVASGERSVDDALLQLKEAPFEDLGFAKLDHHRALRQGAAEVIYGAGKTPEQILKITQAMLAHGQKTVLITRLSKEAAEFLTPQLPLTYHELGKVGIAGTMPEPTGRGTIVIATGGTSDQPVAEEAALTAEALGNKVVRLYDVGVAGLHRLLSHTDDVMRAQAIVAIAGMEGRSWRVSSAALPTARSSRFRRAWATALRLAAWRRFCHAQLLRQRRERCEHRQRLWSRISGQHDQPYRCKLLKKLTLF